MNRLLYALLILPYALLCQETKEEAEYNKLYQQNIQLEYINDVYIPVDVEDAIKELDRLSNEEGRQKFLEAEEELVADRLVYGLGKWMIVHWNFYDGSRLSHKMKEYGVTHPDDMARFLIISYHRHLRNAPLELSELGKEYFDRRKKEQEQRNLRKKEIDG